MNLVERDHAPGGFQLVNPEESGKRNQFDLVELASTIQTVNEINYFQNESALKNQGSLELDVGHCLHQGFALGR